MLHKIFAMVFVLLLCSACAKLDKKFGAYKPDRNAAYLKQEPAPPLKMPEGLQLDPRFASDKFPIPQGPRPAPGSDPVSIIPPTLNQPAGDSSHAAT